MNLTHCIECGKKLVIGPNATNKKCCSTKCHNDWWHRQDFKGATQQSRIEKRDGPSPKVELSEPRAAWLAAAIDGEGTIGIWRQRSNDRFGWKYRPIVQVVNTNLEFIRTVESLVEGYVSVDEHPKRKVPHHKVCYRAWVSAKAVSGVLEKIKSHLVIKRKQADLVLEFCRAVAASPVHNRAMQPEFERLYQECKVLNKRGIK